MPEQVVVARLESVLRATTNSQTSIGCMDATIDETAKVRIDGGRHLDDHARHERIRRSVATSPWSVTTHENLA